MLRKNLKLYTVVSFVILAFGAGTVLAQVPPPPRSGSSFEQRVKQRKQQRNVQIDERDERRLERRCVRTQSNLRELQQETQSILGNRELTYRKVDAKLWIAIGKLKLAGQDTFRIEGARNELAKQTRQFNISGEHYLQAIDDSLSINCQSDLVGFIALVQTLRLYNDGLNTQGTEIRRFVNNQIKPTLSDYSSELRQSQPTEAED